jgi:hypothetical protein
MPVNHRRRSGVGACREVTVGKRRLRFYEDTMSVAWPESNPAHEEWMSHEEAREYFSVGLAHLEGE